MNNTNMLLLIKSDHIIGTREFKNHLVQYFRLLVLFSFLFYSCSDNGSEDDAANEYLVSANMVSSYNTALLRLGASQQGFTDIAERLNYEITVYEIEYNTTYLGSDIIASGLIGIPTTDEEVPILSFQHGTISADRDAPTNSTEGLLYASFASMGYISLVPDFIGFGSSSEIVHPYYHEESTATAVIDMVRAANEFIADNGINTDSRLFLAGYSEGGYATMVTHKAIEENFDDEFDLVASAPASGGYDLIGMKDYFISLDTYDQPFYLAFLSLAYSEVYDLTDIISDLFNEPYATAIPDLFDGSKSGSQINGELNTDIASLLTANFINNSATANEFEQLNSELENNSPISWKPQHPVYMYHGTADITVPFANSQSSYDHLISAGASSNLISFISLEGATHSTGVVPYVLEFTSLFEDLK